jgi:uncharacterized protein (DUF1800 family)
MASLSPLSGALGKRLAKHLLRRTTYKVNKARIDQFAALTAAQAVDLLMTTQSPSMNQPVDPADSLPWINPVATTTTLDPTLRYVVLSWWLNEARLDATIGSKMQFFWHQNFTASLITAGSASGNYFDYLALFRLFALGNVKTLAKKIVTDNTMLNYLNNNQNSKSSPNENFAREFFELFTIQKGPQIGTGNYTNYTEDDIVAAAKVLTGFRTAARGNPLYIDPETNLTRGNPKIGQHDTSAKQFSAAFGNKLIPGATTAVNMWTELDTFVSMIFDQDATAKSYIRRLYIFFVSRFIDAEIEADIIAPLAADLKANGYEILPILKKLFASQHFFDKDDAQNTDELIGGMIKSPVEIVLQTMTMFDVAVPDPLTQSNAHYITFWNRAVQQVMFGYAGLSIFTPSDVAGYPAYYQSPDFHRSWFNSATIVARYKVGEMFVTGKRVLASGNLGGVQLDLAKWLKNSGTFTNIGDAEALVQQFTDYLFSETPDSARFNYFVTKVFSDQLPLADWTYEWNKYLTSGVSTEVNLWLNRLLTGLMYSPEYQVF